MTVATAALVPALGYYVTIDRRFGPELFGFIGSAWSVGYLFGSLGAGRLRPARIGGRLTAAGAAIGVLVMAIATTALPVVYLVAASGIGAALAVQLVSYLTLRASVTPDELLGRVGSTARTLSVGLQPVGMLVTGFLIDAANGGVALLTMGAICVIASVLFSLSRSLRHAAVPP